LDRGRRYLAIAGVAGFVITYAIDAQKLSLLLPVVILLVYGAIALKRNLTLLYTAALAAVVVVCSVLSSYTFITRTIIDIVVFRSIAVTGQTYSQYYDVFSARGYTWWSNVRGIGLIVPPPEVYRSDPFWPELGRIGGYEYFGGLAGGININANPFAGDGIAAAGAVGVVVIGAVMAVWLRVLDVSARRWNEAYVLMVIAPVGLVLANVHFTTALLSFGGVFWIAMFMLYKLQVVREGGSDRR
jgi:hypothetical protein